MVLPAEAGKGGTERFLAEAIENGLLPSAETGGLLPPLIVIRRYIAPPKYKSGIAQNPARSNLLFQSNVNRINPRRQKASGITSDLNGKLISGDSKLHQRSCRLPLLRQEFSAYPLQPSVRQLHAQR